LLLPARSVGFSLFLGDPMYLREKDGKYKGQIRDFPPEVARNLLATGRAENPFAEPPQPSLPVVQAQAMKIQRKGRHGNN